MYYTIGAGAFIVLLLTALYYAYSRGSASGANSTALDQASKSDTVTQAELQARTNAPSSARETAARLDGGTF